MAIDWIDVERRYGTVWRDAQKAFDDAQGRGAPSRDLYELARKCEAARRDWWEAIQRGTAEEAKAGLW